MARNGDRMAILTKVASCLPRGSPWRDRIDAAIERSGRVGVHLAVFTGHFLEAILDGSKKIESRFGVTRRTPFEKVQRGDIILLKRAGGPVVGLALAGDTLYCVLTPDVLRELRDRFAIQLCAENDEFWAARADKRFASLIEIDDRVKIANMAVEKHDRCGWVTYMESRQSCLALTN
jgi:hypothetical protein